MSEGYTVLRVTEDGVPFREHHQRRLARGGPGASAAFAAFCAQAAPGIYALRYEAGALEVTPRARSLLRPGIGVRYAVSPFASLQGRFPKPAPPNDYQAVRNTGWVTLLTDRSGEELFEACTAAVIAWTGRRWITPPEDRPRVASVVEDALEEAGLLDRAPLRVAARQPLLLLNAVVGACPVSAPELPAVPEAALEEVERALRGFVR